jgi:hypothetical protein
MAVFEIHYMSLSETWRVSNTFKTVTVKTGFRKTKTTPE